MRRLTIFVLCAFLLASAGCKQKRKRSVDADAEPAGLATMIHAADPRSAVQFIKGFHTIEAGAWRWTQKEFSVMLKPPANAAVTGATLQLRFVFPDVIAQKTGPITLSAHIGDLKLGPETYPTAGEFSYSREIPASALKGDAVTVDFSTDKGLAAGEVDARELALIVKMVGFEAKQ